MMEIEHPTGSQKITDSVGMFIAKVLGKMHEESLNKNETEDTGSKIITTLTWGWVNERMLTRIYTSPPVFLKDELDVDVEIAEPLVEKSKYEQEVEIVEFLVEESKDELDAEIAEPQVEEPRDEPDGEIAKPLVEEHKDESGVEIAEQVVEESKDEPATEIAELRVEEPKDEPDVDIAEPVEESKDGPVTEIAELQVEESKDEAVTEIAELQVEEPKYEPDAEIAKPQGEEPLDEADTQIVKPQLEEPKDESDTQITEPQLKEPKDDLDTQISEPQVEESEELDAQIAESEVEKPKQKIIRNKAVHFAPDTSEPTYIEKFSIPFASSEPENASSGEVGSIREKITSPEGNCMTLNLLVERVERMKQDFEDFKAETRRNFATMSALVENENGTERSDLYSSVYLDQIIPILISSCQSKDLLISMLKKNIDEKDLKHKIDVATLKAGLQIRGISADDD